MTNKEAIWILKNATFLGTKTASYQGIEEAVEIAVKALSSIDQIRWERDAAIKQLEDLGYMSDPIERQAAIDAMSESLKRVFPEHRQIAEKCFSVLPSAQSEIIHCRDCEHWQSEEFIGNNNVHTLNLASLPCKNWLTAGDWYCGSAKRGEA